MRDSDRPVSRRVILADDHSIIRQGISQLLQSIGNVEVVAEADNGLAAIALVKQHSPDMLVLDAAMPMARGIEVYTEVRRWSPQTRIIVLTGFTSISLLSDWLEAGIDGLLLKTCSADEILKGCRTVLEGGSYIAPEVSEMLSVSTHPTTLTAREREVLALIASGCTNNIIAERLCISVKTVEKHRGSLMVKLNVHSVAELMVYALREGLLEEHKQL
ncbi:MAG: response regulator [bacterium]